MAIERFYRQGALAKLLGFDCVEQLRDAIRRGVIPPPDGRLGGRMRIWRESTVEKLQRDALAHAGEKGVCGARPETRKNGEVASQPP